MNRWFWLLFTLLFPIGALSQSVQFSWTGNGNTTLAACSPTVTTFCLVGYQLSDITTPTAPVIISSTIALGATSYSLTPLPSIGSHTWGLYVLGKDQAGNAIISAPETVTATVPAITLNPPTGLTAVP